MSNPNGRNPMPDKAKDPKKVPPARVAESIFAALLTPAPKSERKTAKG